VNFDEILGGLKNDFDKGPTRISQEELEAQKVDPKDVKLPVTAFSRTSCRTSSYQRSDHLLRTGREGNWRARRESGSGR